MKEDEFLNIRDLSFFHTMHKPNKNSYLGYRYNMNYAIIMLWTRK